MTENPASMSRRRGPSRTNTGSMRTVRPVPKTRARTDLGGRRAWRAAAPLLGVVLVLSSCSGDGGAEGAIATTTTGQAPTTVAATTTTRSPEANTKAAVLAAYRAFWDDVVAAARTADWRSPRLDDHATGKMLDRIRGQFRALEFQGWVARGTIEVSPRLASLTGRKATVQDCVDGSRFRRYDPKKRQWLDSGGGQPDRQRSTLTLDGQGNWKVADSEVSGKCAG
jgi:hypothetical protein